MQISWGRSLSRGRGDRSQKTQTILRAQWRAVFWVLPLSEAKATLPLRLGPHARVDLCNCPAEQVTPSLATGSPPTAWRLP